MTSRDGSPAVIQATPPAEHGAAGGHDELRLADARRLPLAGDALTIGRAPTNDIVVDDPLIADCHARLERFPTGWVLINLAGADRTAVNDQWVTRPTFLAPGDTIRLGRLLVTFRAGGLGGSLAPTSPGGAAPAGQRGRARARPGTPLIWLRDVVKTYPTTAGPLPVLRGVSLTVQAGEFVAIVGPSGSGKSTLLNIITGIDRPDAGEVIVDDQNLREISPNALVSWRGRTIGIVFQFFQLLPTLTVAENVRLPMAFCHTYRGAAQRARAMEVLAQVGMAHLADRLPNALSGGEQQRVAIARALANDPAVLVADEPTGNLDEQTGRQIFELFRALVAAGTTVLMVTHDPALARQASRRIAMRDGSIVDAL
ncbi:MAG TPA: ATP-binding cassette domain-containing protein [Chloroflexota bacterium]|nr:ATP-binding cassette domain-containing protein [Chloroflexota bacterium]